MIKWLGEFIDGFVKGINGLIVLALTVALWGILITGSWWVLIWLVKSITAMLTGMFV